MLLQGWCYIRVGIAMSKCVLTLRVCLSMHKTVWVDKSCEFGPRFWVTDKNVQDRHKVVVAVTSDTVTKYLSFMKGAVKI